jgi:CubicO group peptidase (beta-lactamase class C family)
MHRTSNAQGSHYAEPSEGSTRVFVYFEWCGDLSAGTLKAMQRFFLLAAMVSLVSCAPYAIKSSTASSIDALFADYDKPGSPGASLAVIDNGKIFYSKAYGMADLETRTPATTYTNYRLASVTKQFTAMAVLMLVDRGKLTLDSRLTDVLPGAPTYLREVKIRHLLNHTSGIVDYEDLIPESQTVQVLDKDVLSLLRGIDSVYFAAGAKFKYSNSGYSLLALVVESISGQSFAGFLKKNIFGRLGMNHTLAYQQGISNVDNRAYGYSRTDTGFVRTDQSVTSAVLGDGGIYSSVDDLFKWDQALYTELLVRSSLFKEAVTPAKLNDGSRTTYGFGWYIEPYKNSTRFLHEGSTRGFRNAILRMPDQQLTVIILTNQNEGEPIQIARKIADLMLLRQTP